jgi:hypothetical protein
MDIVINEIMYHPLSEDADDEYIELYNRGTSAVNLGGWQLNDGVEFTFSPNTTLAPNGFLVIGRNSTRLLEHYPQLNGSNCVGNFAGSLSNSGERIVLTRPESFPGTAGGVSTETVLQVAVDGEAFVEFVADQRDPAKRDPQPCGQLPRRNRAVTLDEALRLVVEQRRSERTRQHELDRTAERVPVLHLDKGHFAIQVVADANFVTLGTTLAMRVVQAQVLRVEVDGAIAGRDGASRVEHSVRTGQVGENRFHVARGQRVFAVDALKKGTRRQ